MIIPSESRIWLDIVCSNLPTEIRSQLIDSARELAVKFPAHQVYVAECRDYKYKHYIALLNQERIIDTVYTLSGTDTAKEPTLLRIWIKV